MDQRVILNGVTWKDFELMLLIRGDRAAPCVAYANGRIELMSPSFAHEYIKTHIARILEAWAVRHDVELEGVGSWTLKDASLERGGRSPTSATSSAPARGATARTSPSR